MPVVGKEGHSTIHAGYWKLNENEKPSCEDTDLSL